MIALDPAGRRTHPWKRPRRGGHSNAGGSDEPPGDTMMREELPGCRSTDDGNPRQRGGTDSGEVTTDAAEGDVEHHRVEGRDEGRSSHNCKARPRAGSDLISGREPVTIHGAFV